MHDKGGVHGRGPWQAAASPKLEKPPSSQDGEPALQRLGVSPTVTSPLERSGAFKEAELDELRNDDLLLLEGLRRNAALFSGAEATAFSSRTSLLSVLLEGGRCIF